MRTMTDDRSPPSGDASDLPALPTLQRRLRFARDRARMSQEDAAEALGRSRTILHGLEAGKRDITDAEAIELARIYKVPVKWLLGASTDVLIDGSRGDVPTPQAPRIWHGLTPRDAESAIRQFLEQVREVTDEDFAARLLKDLGRGSAPRQPAPPGSIEVSPGQILFDEEMYERILEAKTLGELAHIAPRVPKGNPFYPQISFGVSPRTSVITYQQALARQSEIDEHIFRLVTRDRERQTTAALEAEPGGDDPPGSNARRWPLHNADDDHLDDVDKRDA